MYRRALGQNLVEEGKLLVDGLRERGYAIELAFWYFQEGGQAWRLILVMPAVEHPGPLSVYPVVREIFAEKGPTQLRVFDIGLHAPSERAHFEESLHSTPTTSYVGPAGLVFHDAFVYQ